MKTKSVIKLTTTFVLLMLFATGLFAGGVKVKSGDLSSLKSEKKIQLIFDYSNFRVGDMSEADYVAKRVNEYNAKEPGKGEEWKKGWEGARKSRFQPKFTELFNEQLEGKMVASENADDAKYTLVVKVTFLEPGFNVGVMKKPAYADFEYTISEKLNAEKPKCVLLLDKVTGSQFGGYDFDIGSRVAESFALSGKILGKYFDKELK